MTAVSLTSISQRVDNDLEGWEVLPAARVVEEIAAEEG